MQYWQWLVLVSLAFVALERLFPWRRQRLWRQGWLRDVGFLAFNGHFAYYVFAPLNAWAAAHATVVLRQLGLAPTGASAIAGWPFPAQLVVCLVLADFLQWCIHVLLHRVSGLWTFHQVHHSILEMDFAGNFRFHWMELIVYRTLQWLPLGYLGVPVETILPVAVFTTAWGHFNHSNLDVGLGAAGYVFNSPRMHLWHHDASAEGGRFKNFGIVFSLWDYLFATAFWPRDRSPGRLGYPGVESMPLSFFGQECWPLFRRRA